MLGLGEIALGASSTYAISLLLMVAVGFGAILMSATANTTMQLAVPDGLRGRVMSVYTTIFAGSTPVGGPLMGGFASAFGVAVSLAIGGVIATIVGLGAFVWIRRSGLDRITRGPCPRPRRPPSASRRAPRFPWVTRSAADRRLAQASTAPKTSAALRPPNPNEVDSTRR